MDRGTGKGSEIKHLYRIVFILLALGFALTVALLVLLPDTVPVHYNFAGEVDRMGSKYEYLVFPCLGAVASAIFLPLAKRVGIRKEDGHVLVEKVLLGSAIGEILLFNGLGAHFMWKARSYVEGTATSAMSVADGMRLLSLLMGVLLIILGSVIPKVRKNALFGLRTKWSMSSDRVWQKSQRFAGFASIAAGALLLAAAAFLKGMVNLLAQTVIFALWAVICVVASYEYYKRESSL